MRYFNIRGKCIAEIFKDNVTKHPKKICYHFEDTVWTYEQVEELSNKIARYFKQEGFQKGDTVALLLENRPEYIAFWLGLSKIGAVTALINSNLVNQPLLHSITIANSKAVIYGSDYTNAINDIRVGFKQGIKLYQYNTKDNVNVLKDSVDLVQCMKFISGAFLGNELVRLKPTDNFAYVYTSGTTGLPKAAIIKQTRYFLMIIAIKTMLSITAKDIVYNPLPLYHSAGGIVGAGMAVINGSTVVIRRKFSASNYWKDCVKYKCTVAQYIGELCRYLLAVPPGDPSEKAHSVRLMFGNGLRSHIWNNFVDRFGIKHIGEFYGATEGNSNIVNFEGVSGAVGFKPRYIGDLYPVSLVKFDEITREILRDSNGFCIRCEPNEPGIFVGKINRKNAVNDFAGYTDKSATKEKVLENVFRKGDCFFNSGDILVMDELGYFYFKDRTGDTFRWKGENVATSEVEGIISNVVKLQDAVVYGVQVPNTEGRCGMAAIVDETNSLDLIELAKGLRKNLPAYACPVFLRIMPEVPLTGTFKLKKVDLQADGFNINKIKDKLYYYDPKASAYVPITEKLYKDIMEGIIRL